MRWRALLAPLALLTGPASAGDLIVEARGTFVSGTPPAVGTFVNAQIGDPVTLRFEVDLPVMGTAASGTTFTWMDNSTFALRIGNAVEGHRFPAGGLCWWIDDVVGIDGIHVREEALATLGLRVRMRLEDPTQSVFDQPDPLLVPGTYLPSDFGDVTWDLIGASNLTFDLTSVTITAPPIGVTECDPATPNSSGLSAQLRIIGSNRIAGCRLRLLASGMPAQSLGYVLVSQTPAAVPGAGGSQGTLCLGGSIGRYVQAVQSTGANGAFAQEAVPFALPQPTGTVAASVGETWRFQVWFRDANPGPTSNFTDAFAVTFR
ncbi:MAG: hypothetical protein AAGA20_19510 [Planctomycetota bacterium]